jgi:hypothetical protein
MRIVHFSTLLLRRSTNLSKHFITAKAPIFKAQRLQMSTESTTVKSRQQPQWLTPTAKPTPTLKFQNSLTKTKVGCIAFVIIRRVNFQNRPSLSPRAVDVSLGTTVDLLFMMPLTWVMLELI